MRAQFAGFIAALVIVSCEATIVSKARLCYLYFGTIDDLGWTFTFNANRVKTHDALAAAFPSVEFESVYEPNVFFGVANKTQLFLDYVASGCNVFITNNELLIGDAATDDWAMATYPNVSFLLLNTARLTMTDRTRKYLDFDFSSSFYLAGATAATQASTCVGFIAAWEDQRNPNDAANGFVLGVRSVNATLPIEIITMNSWYWPDAEARAANLLLERGCEVVGHYTDPRNVDLAVAAHRARTRAKVLSVGAHSNLQQYVGDTVLLAVYEEWANMLIPALTTWLRTGAFNHSRVMSGTFLTGELQTSAVSPMATKQAKVAYDAAVARLRASNGNVFCGPLPLRGGSILLPADADGCLTFNQKITLTQYINASAVTIHPIFTNADSCPAGTFYRYSATGQIRVSCTPCPANSIAASAGSSACVPCPAGTEPSQGATVCVVVAQSSSTALVAGLVAGFSALIILLCGALIAFRAAARRRNRFAPREGPLCLLFTDVESSTTLWQNNPEEMAVAMATHHQVIRQVLEEEEAYEVKTVGDSFMIACKTAVEGLVVATKIQARLQEAPWPSCFLHHEDSIRGLRVRIGVHVCNDVHVKFEQGYYDYYGNDVNATARIESQARGGQILIDQHSFLEARNDDAYAVELEADAVVRVFAVNVTLKGLDETYTLLSVVHRSLSTREFAPLEGHEKDQEVDLEHAASSCESFSETGSQSSATTLRILTAQLQPLPPSARNAVLKQICTAHGVIVAGKGGNYRKAVAALARALNSGVFAQKTSPRLAFTTAQLSLSSPKDDVIDPPLNVPPSPRPM